MTTWSCASHRCPNTSPRHRTSGLGCFRPRRGAEDGGCPDYRTPRRPRYIRCEFGQPYWEFPRYLPTAVAIDTGVFRGSFATNVWVDEWLVIRDAFTGLNAQVGQDAE